MHVSVKGQTVPSASAHIQTCVLYTHHAFKNIPAQVPHNICPICRCPFAFDRVWEHCVFPPAPPLLLPPLPLPICPNPTQPIVAAIVDLGVSFCGCVVHERSFELRRRPAASHSALCNPQVIQLQGDQRKPVSQFLIQGKLAKKDMIKIHGF
ncbi:unnamed protein product [Ostreobium quekettii]|uniref:SUI1 domain-containing protein n=1 Tax=Ostreobium quekettii TaxID=121088 RepID=A0A8S1J700_9CHLO|nr:unnamed protein product [Ostreobium quekettii]